MSALVSAIQSTGVPFSVPTAGSLSSPEMPLHAAALLLKPTWYCQTSLRLVRLVAWNVPPQSLQYNIPPDAMGCAVMPSVPWTDQRRCRVAALLVRIVVSVGE